jgi:acetylxylan esterase
LKRNHIAALLTISAGLLFTVQAQAGSWQSNASFGAKLQGDLYTPTTPAASPAILVAIHYCSGNSGSAHGWFQSAADQYGFYVIAPNAGKNCFDSSLSRDSNSDPGAIVTMVKYLITNKNADASRVFAAGYSSGGCMTNTLLAIFPDVFAGGAALPGYPAGAWPKGDTTCQLCGGSGPGGSDTGQKYADAAKGVFSFSGTRPCSQQWVGGGDEYHFAQWLPVVASEFQILGGLASGSTGTGAPSGWTRTEYKDGSGHVMLQTNLGPSGQKHDLTSAGLNGQVISFLGLDKPTGACGLTTPGGTGGAGGGAGGASGTGGAAGKDGSVDAKDTGAGGIGGSGGVTSSGGSTGNGGNTGAGGATGSGGSTASGGASGKGGVSGNGGATGSGGTTSSGGTTGSGGAGSGGTTSSGGSSGSGGATGSGGSSSGGTTNSGGSSGSGGTTTTDNTAGGCACALGGRAAPGGALWILLGAMVGMALRRRRN